MRATSSLLGTIAFATFVQGHIAAWHKGSFLLLINLTNANLPLFIAMYCLNGTSGSDDPNTDDAVNPLYDLTMSDWWFHHTNGCDDFPPAAGDFLELPAGGSFTIELAANRAFTTLSNDGSETGLYPDGGSHPGLGVGLPSECITQPNSP